MTRSSAREIAVHIIFALGFDTVSPRELLDRELTRERFQELAEELFAYVLSVASGRKVKAEEAGFHDMAIFKQGVTL